MLLVCVVSIFRLISVFQRVAYAELACALFVRDRAQTTFKVEYLKVCALLSNGLLVVRTQERSKLTEENASGRAY